MSDQPPSSLPLLPLRDTASHKGDFGRVAIVGGCCTFMHLAAPGNLAPPSAHATMIGAPCLAAIAALRAGAGLARLVMPAPILPHALVIAPSATGIPLDTTDAGQLIPHAAVALIDRLAAECDALAIGPGLGVSDGARAACLRAVQQQDAPVVVDADALNNLAHVPELTRDLRAAAILTPHPGEFKTLTASMGLRDHLGLTASPDSRARAAEQLAQRLGAIVVLKGAGTVITDGLRTRINTTGHPCLATAGTGDVLTGIIAAFIAQFVAPPSPLSAFIPPDRIPRPTGKPLDLFDAACLAVHVHGLAGEAWATRHAASAGLLAMDLCDEIPAVIESLRAAR